MQVGGVLAAEKYIVDDIKSIYASQGQTVNSKHIELIVRQMFSRIRVLDKGDTEFFPGDIVDIITFKKENDRLDKLSEELAKQEEKYKDFTTTNIAVMGCIVNGPGEARNADI